MTVIDRAHRLVLILVVTLIPAIFLVDFLAEVARDDITVSSGWQAYLLLVAVAGYQVAARKWQADWVVVGGGVATAALGMLSHYGTKTVINATAGMVLVPIVGLVAIAVSRHAPVISGVTLGVAAVVLGTVTWSAEGLPLDDIITKASAVAVLFGMGGWLLWQLRRGYEIQYAVRDKLVAAVGHELRTPLTALTGFSAALMDGSIEPTSGEGEEVIALLASQAQDAAELVEDLLVAFRPESSAVPMHFGRVDLAGEVRRVVDGFSPGRVPDSKCITWRGEAVDVHADDLRVRQIVRNLVTNAVKHGGNDIAIHIGVRDQVGVVAVSDDGTGFESQDADKLFRPYGSLSKDGSRSGSNGLGLTVSRQLARDMGGDLTATRSHERTVFELTLPVVEPA